MTVAKRTFDFSQRTYVMGILNVTPDSFSDGGRFADFDAAIAQALRMEEEGADLIDIGGESTRPGSDRVPVEEELRRVLPVIETLTARLSVPISIDTTKAAVARAAIQAGAAMVNDISGFTFDPSMLDVVASARAPAIIMHTAGDPKTMQQTYRYTDVVEDVAAYFAERLNLAGQAGIPLANLMLDPGIGFGKSVAHNLALLQNSARFAELGCPVIVGPSRKSFIGKVLDLPLDDRLEGTLAAVAVAVMNGANMVRVHDVRPAVRVCRMCDAFLKRVAVD
ncbi:MAG: dihydropteroate synthase [Myxococcales bacterium]|nr:MAG: dihydropteroate synthase [Myxococcales bacterium]